MTPPFPLPVLFTAWTWSDGAGIAGEVIRRAKLGAFKTVAVQLSAAGLDATDVGYMHDAGLMVVGWDPVGLGLTAEAEALPLDGWLPQVESPTQRDALLDCLRGGLAPKLPRALVTTYGGLDTLADVASLVRAWGSMPFTFVECYAADGYPHDDIDRMLHQGTVYGFDATALRALVGTYRGEFPKDYPGLEAANYGGAYLEESMSDDQLRAFAPLAAAAPTPTPEPTVTNDAPQRNADIAKIAEDWLASFGPAPLSRLALIERIATSTDAEWNAMRLYVKDAVDGRTPDLEDALNVAEAKIAAAKTALA
jgi:hypothetical protein